MTTQQQHGINGDPSALSVDRATAELRRGRAIRITDDRTSLVVAAVETASQALFARLIAAAGGSAALFLTAERAHAAGIATRDDGPAAIPVPDGADLEALRALGGVSVPGAARPATFAVQRERRLADLAAGGFKVAKAGRLVPALVGFEDRAGSDAGLVTVSLADVDRHAQAALASMKLTSKARVPLADAVDSEIALFRDEIGHSEHVAVIIGRPNFDDVVPVRLHSACLTGDLLGSLRCDCGEQLRKAVSRIASLGGGVLLYLDQEGRGIGLPNKLRAYVLQDAGLDTVDADQHLGFLADERNYDVAATLLHQLGIRRIQLLTNNPQKISALRDHGIEVVGRLPLVGSTNSHNERYLRAKLERAGHLAEETGGRV
ncbi:MAG TPA: GTP cyclohydrolase II [Gammaproteobacteria bacterium]